MTGGAFGTVIHKISLPKPQLMKDTPLWVWLPCFAGGSNAILTACPGLRNDVLHDNLPVMLACVISNFFLQVLMEDTI